MSERGKRTTRTKRLAQSRVSRRQFLKQSAAIGTAAATVAVSGESLAAEQSTPTEQPKKKGYQRSAHVAAYYKSVRG